MNRSQWVVLGVLALLVVLFVLATARGVGRSDPGTPTGGIDGRVEGLLVRPAQLSDVSPENAACLQAERLVVTAVLPSCTYSLRPGFFAKKLHLSLSSGGSVVSILHVPASPRDNAKRLTGAQPADLIYKEEGSTLTLGLCVPFGATCQVTVGSG